MGGLLSNPMKAVMEDNMEKQMEFQKANMKLQLERQLQMQQEMRARMVAQQLAMGREALDWWAAFYGVAGLGLTAGAIKSRKIGFLAPLIPLSFFVAYQYDMARGNKMDRIIAEADRILANEKNLVALPGPNLNGKVIGDRVEANKNKLTVLDARLEPGGLEMP